MLILNSLVLQQLLPLAPTRLLCFALGLTLCTWFGVGFFNITSNLLIL